MPRYTRLFSVLTSNFLDSVLKLPADLLVFQSRLICLNSYWIILEFGADIAVTHSMT